jgi:putative dimethyl sulfoxide reductase chaperone
MTVLRAGESTFSGELAAGARSYVYMMLARAFDFPTDELAQSLVSGKWAEDIRKVSSHLPFEPPGLEQLALACDDLAIAQKYVKLFDVGPGRPPVPLYEGSYIGGRMKLMEDLVRFYEHFGLKPHPSDRPDHLVAELEFMHFLAFKQAAIAAGGEDASPLVLAQHDFLQRHPCKWLPRVGASLKKVPDTSEFYLALSSFAAEFCTRDASWLRRCRENPDPQNGSLPD